MNDVVLDSSAVLALLKREKGGDVVIDALPGATISAVNVAEIVTKLREDGWPANFTLGVIEQLGLKTVSFSFEHAIATGNLRVATRRQGLSLGDRACLALAMTLNARILTTDAAWLRVDPALGLDIVNIRNPT